MHLFRAIFLVLIAISLISCTKADVKPDGVNGNDGSEGSASFRVRNLEGDATVLEIPKYVKNESGVNLLSTWKVPQTANFRFTACIEDRASREMAVGHQFAIEIPGKGYLEDIPATTSNGCFSWFESIPFNYFVKQSKWVVIERDIVGTGVHVGRQRVKIAINPWAATGSHTRDSGDQVRFLRDKPLNPSMYIEANYSNAALSGDLLGKDKLFVDDIHVQTLRRSESNDGMYLSFKITMKPKVVFENMAGVPQYEEIKDGDFYVIGHLLLNNAGKNMKDRVILTSGGDLPKQFRDKGEVGILGQGKVIDGKLVVRMDGWVRERRAQGNLEFALKLIPKGVRGVGEYQGIYELGPIGTLDKSPSGTLTMDCREGGSCDVSKYIKTASNFKDIQSSAYKGNNLPYLFDRIKLRFIQVEPGETTTERTVAYAASICIADAYTGDRPYDLPFRVRYKDTGEVFDLKTKNDGCLYWNSRVSHYYYHPEEFIQKVVTIEKGPGVSRDVTFNLNPWDDKFTFGFDEVEFLPEFWQKLKTRKKIPSRFFLSSFGYHTVRFQYNINSLMDLEVKKTVLMDLSPRVLRYSGIINARKMTEPTRDGIWLMKVAIQKNYLDPSQMGMFIDKLQNAQSILRTSSETDEQKQLSASNRLRKLNIEVPGKEFITSKTTLVRSTDGVIVQPVELSMHDLRLMRIRSNFLIQFEPVDERQLQKQNVLSAGFSKTIDELLQQRQIKGEGQRKRAEYNQDGSAQVTDEDIAAEEEARIKEVIEERSVLTRRLFDDIGKQLYDSGKFEVNLKDYSLNEDQLKFVNPMLNKLQLELAVNDFTNIRLPSCDQLDCQSFVARNSGLEKRTFVGPVIFLSNAYSDSVRATDNLDEARCGQTIDYQDPFEADLRDYERSLFSDADTQISPLRQNTLYRFSEYFGSLRHLCSKHVDDLITREKEDRLLYQKNMPAISSVSNFVEAFGYDYISLSNEKPLQVDFSSENLRRCNGDLTSCMRETQKNWIPMSSVLGRFSRNLDIAEDDNDRGWLESWIRGASNEIKTSNWTSNDIAMALFDQNSNIGQKRFAKCVLVVSQLTESAKRIMGAKFGARFYSELERRNISYCMQTAEDPIVEDYKYRVVETGRDGDSYVFMGGYQMNINVGQSFGVSRSKSLSHGWGFELTDVVMPFAKAFSSTAGNVVKPFSYKISQSNSFASSDGTSVSDSTYLVAQIAKFRVRLDKYERCVGLSVTPDFARKLRNYSGGGLVRLVNSNNEVLSRAKPVFVCEGVYQANPKFVDEMYFYFTQHFTEGDMLDQADLYNHPWLLALRGYRDFYTFVDQIHAQEVVSWKKVMNNIFKPEMRPIDWPLAHMRETYRMMVPSFPGFYTVLDPATEGLTQFPLEQRVLDQNTRSPGIESLLQNTDADVNGEVYGKSSLMSEKAVPGTY